MALATLTIDINARLANIERDLGKVSHLAEQSGNRMKAAFAGATAAFASLGVALGAGAFVSGIKGVIDGADQLQKASQKYGVAVEQLSALKYAGELSDVGLEAIGNGLKKLSTNMLDTAADTGEAKDAFKALGIGVKDATGGLKSSDAVLAEIADRFAGMEDGAGKTAIAVKLFGRAGADLIPLLNQGSRGMAEMKEEAERLGAIVGGDLATKSAEFNDNLTRLSASMGAFKIALAGGVIEKLVDLTNALVESTKAADGFWKGLLLLGGDQANNPVRALEEVKARLENLKKLKSEIEGTFVNKSVLRDVPFLGTAGDLKNLEGQIAFAEKQRNALQALADRRGAFDFGPAVWEPDKKKALVPPGKEKKETDDEVRQMQALGNQYESLWKSAEKYAAGLDAQLEKGRALTQSEQMLLEVERLLPAEWAASVKPLIERANALEKTARLMEEGRKLTESTRTPIEVLAAEQIHLNELLDARAISWDVYAREVFAAQDSYDAANKKLKETTDEMTEFAKQAARNMQDAMGDFFFDAMEGKLDDLAGNFTKTINRMVANLMASQLMNFLTGDFGKTGQMGGALGNIFGSLFGGARAGGGPVSAGSAYLVGEEGPELFRPNQSGTIIPNGGAVAVYNNFTISGQADRRSQQQIAAEVGAAVDRAVRRNR